MKSNLRLLMALSGMALISACASTPDPAVMCSSEWIAPRAESAVSRIEKRAKSSIKTLSSVSKTWAEGKTPGPIQLFSLSRAMKSLEKELTKGQGIKDLKMVAKTCNDPTIINTSMRDLLKRQGVSDQLITRIEASPIYERAISSLSKPEPVVADR